MGLFTRGEKAPLVERAPASAPATVEVEKNFASKEAAVLAVITQATMIINCFGQGKGQFNGAALARFFDDRCLPILKSAVADGYFASIEDAVKDPALRETLKSLRDEIKAANRVTEEYFADRYVK